jgi:hypothetical protein
MSTDIVHPDLGGLGWQQNSLIHNPGLNLRRCPEQADDWSLTTASIHNTISDGLRNR